MLDHASEQIIARYGVRIRPETLAQKIFEKKATLVAYGHKGRLIYDVPVEELGRTIRCVYVAAPAPAVITVLPPQFRREIWMQEKSDRKSKNAQRRAKEAQRFRQANAEDDEDDFDS
jgi:hypothetical protein